MHPATLLILGCTCAVYARDDLVYKSHRNGSTHRAYNRHEYKLKRFTRQKLSSTFDYAPIASLEPQFELKSPWDTQAQYPRSNKEYSSRSQDQYGYRNDSPKLLPDPPEVWVAPPYYQSLKDYDAALLNIKSHLTPEAHTNKNDKNFRYIVLSVIVDGLSRLVAERGWAYYDNHYRGVVKSLTERAVVNPQGASHMIRCVFYEASRNIQGIRALLNHKWVKYLCKAQPTACDTLILAQMKLNPPKEKLEQEADLLLKLGQAASTYLTSYAGAFDAVSEQNVFLYIDQAKDTIRELVRKISIVRKTLYPNGGPTSDTCKTAPNLNDYYL